jgi:hypothetical protein
MSHGLVPSIFTSANLKISSTIPRNLLPMISP